MSRSIKPKKKRRGRPPTGPFVGVRLRPEMIKKLDAWARKDDTTRSQAIRQLLEQALAAQTAKAKGRK
jgi:metal-responsive CopG/Arc/MetJ family transcriptional regulator